MAAITGERPIPTGEGLTFEKVWAMFQETDRKIQETTQQMKETDRIIKENALQMKETDRQMKETDRQIGKLCNRFGEMVEHLVAPSIHKRFNELGYHFDGVASGGYVIRDEENGKVIAEVDILLENDKYIMGVEVKAKMHLKDIEHHVKRLEILRQYRNRHHDTRKIQGAIAGAIFGDAEKQAAIAAGFYVLEQSGDTVKMDIPEDFVPREW
jgi:hypothetical protein